MSLWTYPKITPFRLAFILTTSGLGISKTILVSNGKTASSTTVEWITGVIVAIIFQLLGSYDCEYNSARPQHLDWIFCYDCLGRSYITIANPHPAPRTPPIVTGYRLLLSTVFAAFGIAKMLCGYLGFSSAMYTLDWIIAIPLALGLYYIGLYEEPRAMLLRKFFDVDYSSQTLLAFKIGRAALWFTFWSGALRIAFVHSKLYPEPSHDNTRQSALWNVIFENLLKWIAISFCLAMLEAGALNLDGALLPVIKACSGRYASSIRFGGVAVCAFTLYVVFSLICICVTLFLLFVCVQICSLMTNPPANFDKCFITSIGLAWMMIIVAMLGSIPASILFRLPKMVISYTRSLLSKD